MTPSPPIPIHPQARIDPEAEIGPYCSVGPEVRIGAGTRLIGHVTLMGKVTLGKGNTLYPGVVIGGEPQDRHYGGSETEVVVGDHNVIRESVTIHRGSEGPPGITAVGSNCYLMPCAHVGHDSRLGNNVVLVNGALLGSHVHVLDHATLSGGAIVHPRTTIGEYSFVSGLSRVRYDVPPYTLVDSDAHAPGGINVVALRRNGFPDEVIAALRETHRLIYVEQIGVDEARETLRRSDRLIPPVNHLLSFVQMQLEGRHGRARERLRNAA